MKKYLQDQKQFSYHIFRRYLPHFQVELSQQNVCTLISALKSRAVLMDLFVLTACFRQGLSYLTCDIGHKIIFSLMWDKRSRLSRRGCEGQKNRCQWQSWKLKYLIFSSVKHLSLKKTVFVILNVPTSNTFPPLIQRPFLSNNKFVYELKFIRQKYFWENVWCACHTNKHYTVTPKHKMWHSGAQVHWKCHSWKGELKQPLIATCAKERKKKKVNYVFYF